MTSPSEQLKQRIMRRVYAAWFWKNVAPMLAVELVLVLGIAAGVLSQLSVRQILMNAISSSGSTRAFLQFFVDNFFVKSVQSQLLAVLYVVFLGFVMRDIRGITKRFTGTRGNSAYAFAGARNQFPMP